MNAVRRTTSVPPARLWEVLVQVERLPEMTPSMTRVEVVTSGALGKGSRVRIAQPKLPEAVWEVTRWDPPHRFDWVSRAPGVTTTGTHTVRPHGEGGSALDLAIEHRGPLAWLARLLWGKLGDRYVAQEAEGVVRAAEQPDGPGDAPPTPSR